MKWGSILIVLVFIVHGAYAQQIKVKGATVLEYSADGKFFAVAEGSKIEFYSTGESIIRTYSGHSRVVETIAFSNNNEMMATGSADKTIKIWSLQNGSELLSLSGHTKAITQVKFSPDDRFLASISEDMSLKVWDVKSGEVIFSEATGEKSLRALDISQDGNYIATGGGDGHIVVTDLNTGKRVARWEAHRSWVRDVAFSPDSKLLASASEDKTIVIWTTDSWSKATSFEDQKGWIVDVDFSPDGKYLMAASDDRNVYVYEVETRLLSFKKQVRNPILNAAISPDGKSLAVVEQFSSELNFFDISALKISPVYLFKDESDKNPPQIFISNPPNTQSGTVRFSQDLIDISGTIIDESGVRKLRVNGIETPLRDNGNFIIKVPLTAGDNYITIEATDVNENIALKKFNIIRRDLTGGAYDPAKAKNYVFIVGINNYEHWPNLYNAVRDANEIASTLIGLYDFDFSNVNVLLDEKATRNNIYEQLRSYIEKVTPNDNLLVFFSGHGYFDELLNEGYWVPQEANTGSAGEYLPNSSILKILENVNSQHTLLVADACFSGSLFAEQQRGFAENVEKFRSRWGLASGRLETVSDGAYGQNSPFADAIIEFLKNNDKDKIAVSELVQYVKINVADKANQTPIGNPLKSIGDEGGEFVFYKRK